MPYYACVFDRSLTQRLSRVYTVRVKPWLAVEGCGSEAESTARAPLIRFDRSQFVDGLILGSLIGFCSTVLGLYGLFKFDDVILAGALFGGIISLTRLTKLLVPLTLLLLTMVAVIAYTPLAESLMHGWLRRDPLHKAPAVVVLSAAVHSTGELSDSSLERDIRAYSLLQAGYAHTLVLTSATVKNGSQIPAVKSQMRSWNLRYPIIDSGPAADTHDEAVNVAKIAAAHKWSEVILVTHPMHMRRAAAAFEKTGLKVISCPCVEGGYDMADLNPSTRLAVFRDWLHEWVGCRMYASRGWI